MLPSFINPAPLAFTVALTFGVLVHDTQIDRAATLGLAIPASFAAFAAVDSVIKSSEQHVHVERTSAPSSLATLRGTSVPRIQPRDDDRRYIQSKKLNFGTSSSTYLWPSV